MKIGINASFLRKQHTGLGQVSTHFINTLIQLHASDLKLGGTGRIEFVLYCEEDVKLKLPKHFSKKVFLPPYKRDDLIRKIWWERFLLPRMAKKDGCDLFLSPYQSPTVFSKKMPHIMIVHDLIPRFFSGYLNNSRKKIYQSLTEKAIQKATKIIAVSHRTEKDLIQHLGVEASKITVLYNDVDPIYKKIPPDDATNKILKKYHLAPGYIYHGGGLEVRKNSEAMLRAYAQLLGDKKNHAFKIPKLVISGKLMPELAPLVTDVQKLAKELKIEKHVFFLDYVPQEDLPSIYRSASVFVYPSHYEGFGLPVLEAMNQGTPVITAKTSSLPEVGADAVLYCNPDDFKDLAMTIKNVLTNEHLRIALSLKGRERAKRFSWNVFVSRTMHIAGTLYKNK